MYNKIRLGYHSGFHSDKECGKQDSKIRINRTCMMLDNFPKKTIQTSIKLATKNTRDLLKILEWNESQGIKFFRISSDICPHISNWRLLDGDVLNYRMLAYDLEIFKDNIIAAGNYAKAHGHRLTFHPGFFTVLNTNNNFILITVMRELWWHTKFLDMLWPDGDGTLTIHIGGVYGNKETAIENFIKNFKKLPSEVKRRIIIENDENNFCVEDLLYINTIISIPICFDYFHYLCWNLFHKKDPKKYKLQKPLNKLLPEIIKTWGNRRPKFHLSEQMPDKPIGTHSNFIVKIPKILASLDIDIMLESKCRELSVLALKK